MVEEVHVQVAVSVVVEEERLCGVAHVLESQLPRAVGERAIAIVHVEHVASPHGEIAHAGHVQVEPAIAVDIGHRDARGPSAAAAHPRALGHVLERVIPFVEIEPVGAAVRGEIQVGQPVAVHVARSNSTPVIEVEIVENVERGVLGQPVLERHTSLFGRERFKQRRRLATLATGRACDQATRQQQ